MEFLYTIFENAVFEILVFIVGCLVPIIKNKLQINKKKRILKVNAKNCEVMLYTSNTLQNDAIELTPLGYPLEYQSVGVLVSMFNREYKNSYVYCKMSPTSFGEIAMVGLKKNVLLIGGPSHNSVSKELFDLNIINHSIYFDNTNVLHCFDDKWEPRLAGEQNNLYYEEDYALILNISNPWNDPKTKRLIAIMGCRGVGTFGGAIYFDKLLYKDCDKIPYDEYALVIECHGDPQRLTDAPVLKKCYNLNSINE